MKYLKLFLTTLLYNNYAADELNFILPNVSLCDDAPTIVYFNPLKLSINPIVSMANWTYGLTSSEPVVSGNLGNGEVTYYYKLLSENSWSTTKPSNAGSYNVRADIAETEDYLSGTCLGTFTITRANRTISFTSAPTEVAPGNTITVSASPSAGSGYGTITYGSSNSSIARISNNVITGVSTGTVTITATISQSTNYNSASTSYSLSVVTKVIAKFNVTDTSNPTQIIGELADSPFSAIEIDGVVQPSVVSSYTFSTTGEHTVKYTLTDQTSIGSYAFYYCSSLTSIVIPDSVISIGDYIFLNCNGLEEVIIPNNITYIGPWFGDCESLTSINIPNSVVSIDQNAFCNCDLIYFNTELRDRICSLADGYGFSCD